MRLRAFGLVVAWLLAACAPAPTPTVTPIPTVTPSAQACTPTDQDQYVYHPTRLVVLQACTYATGTVAAIRIEPDGDYHVLLKPDPPYAGLVNAANSGPELGDLVVEPICVHTPTQTDAVAPCAADKDPISVTGLTVGMHVWFEGRYVTDSDHGGWAELHPLYVWGAAPGTGIALPSQTPAPIIDSEAP